MAGDRGWHVHFVQVVQCLGHRLEVALHHGFATLAVRLLDAVLDGLDRLVTWEDP